MLRKAICLLIAFALCAGLFSSAFAATSDQYQLKSGYLKNPDSVKALADQTAALWEKAYDSESGGFYTYVNRDGSVDMSRPYKVTMVQSRDAYGLIRAYQLTGKKEYLDCARKALDFMYKNAWDGVNGGWYQEMNKDGTIATQGLEGMPWNDMFKWAYNQFYALSGMTAMYDATRNDKDKAWIEKSFSALEKDYDTRPGLEGYFEMPGKDWSNPSTKSIVIMDAVTTHEEVLSLLGLDDKYKKRFLSTADQLYNHIVKSMDERQFGINSYYDNDWNAVQQQPSVGIGNMLKPAWCLARAYLVDPKPQYREGAQKLLNQIIASGLDSVNGGPYTALDGQTGAPADKSKCYWIMEQAMTSGLTNYYITKNTDYLKLADESMDFFAKHLYDQQYGSAYRSASEFGVVDDTSKGTYWDDAYHNLEMFYYAYLYGNLMIQNRPVTLFYNIEADKKDKEVKLQPVSLGEGKLEISSVTLNGKKYNQFDAKSCTLKLTGNKGGEFKVTFRPVTNK